MAVLNSPITQFFMDKQFHSLKILRSHIEAIPIPLAGEKEQAAITLLVDELLTALQKGHTLMELPACRLINEQIARLYGLTQEESQLIQQTVRF